MSVRVVDRQGTPGDEVRFRVGGRQRSRRVDTPEDAHAFDAGIRAWLWPQWFGGGIRRKDGRGLSTSLPAVAAAMSIESANRGATAPGAPNSGKVEMSDRIQIPGMEGDRGRGEWGVASFEPAPRAEAQSTADHLVGGRRLMAANRGTGGNTGGIGLGGILVIVGIVLMIVWSFWIGLIVTLVGLIAFGGFAKGKWY